MSMDRKFLSIYFLQDEMALFLHVNLLIVLLSYRLTIPVGMAQLVNQVYFLGL